MEERRGAATSPHCEFAYSHASPAGRVTMSGTWSLVFAPSSSYVCIEARDANTAACTILSFRVSFLTRDVNKSDRVRQERDGEEEGKSEAEEMLNFLLLWAECVDGNKNCFFYFWLSLNVFESWIKFESLYYCTVNNWSFIIFYNILVK